MVSPAAARRVEVVGDSTGWLAKSLRLPNAALVFTGALLSGALLAVLVLLPPPPSNLEIVLAAQRTLRVPAFFVVMLGFYIASVPIAVRSALRSVRTLAGLDENALEGFARELVHLPRRWLWGGLVCACVVHVGILIGVGVSWDDYSRTDLLATRIGFGGVMGWVHAAAMGIATAVLLRQGLLFLRVGREVRSVDLLDHAALAPFVHTSLRLTLLNTLWIACATAFHIDWGGSLAVAPQVIWLMPLLLLMNGCLFTLPLWGIHQRLRAERNAEISRVNAAIRGDRQALHDSLVGADAAALNAVDLLAYRDHVRSFSTWPFDASALLRLGLYLGIPLLGWVGAAIVERSIDVLLD
jgi:hypothetical protein